MDEEIYRGGGIGVRDLENLKSVVGRAAGVARIDFAQRFCRLFRGDLDFLAAFLRACDSLLGKLAEHAAQFDARESEQRHLETIPVQSNFHFTISHGSITLLKRNDFPRHRLASRRAREAESCPASVFGQFSEELPPNPHASMPDESGAVCSVCNSRQKLFREVNTHN